MTSISISDILTVVYILVDDWYQTDGVKLLEGKPGAKPLLTDNEVITLMLAQDYIPYISLNPTCFPLLSSQAGYTHR